MMTTKPLTRSVRGPFRPEQLHSGDPYELSDGHPIECLPTGGRGSRANLVGGLALATDPAVESAGVDTGYAADAYTLRAPDLAVGNVPDAPGWVAGAPPLAVEYADTGQDESDLAVKVRQFLAAGTRLIWVVRLTGPRRVEVYRPTAAGDVASEVRVPGDLLEAPGILRNAVPVAALFDPEAAHEAALRNLLQRRGYDSLEAVRTAGAVAGRSRARSKARSRASLTACARPSSRSSTAAVWRSTSAPAAASPPAPIGTRWHAGYGVRRSASRPSPCSTRPETSGRLQSPRCRAGCRTGHSPRSEPFHPSAWA